MSIDQKLIQSVGGAWGAAETKALERSARALDAATTLATTLGVSLTVIHDVLELEGPAEAVELVRKAYLRELQTD